MVIQTVLSSAPHGSSASDLARQPSIYSLTLEEIQTAMNDPGKPLGSMNMEEFMKSLWTAEECHAMVSVENGGLARQPSLQRLNSLPLPSALSSKTVEDVWKDIQRQQLAASPSDGHRPPPPRPNQQKRQITLGELTLEDFLSRAGAFRDDLVDAGSLLPDKGNAMNLYSAGVPAANGVADILPASINPVTSSGLQADWMKFSSHHQHQQMLQQAGTTAAAAASMKQGLPSQALIIRSADTSLCDGLPHNSGLGQEILQNTLASSPPISEYVIPSRKRFTSEVLIEKTVDRRQKRMIKNRESAARSRARKQAYTVELESEVAKLKEENAILRHQQGLENRLPETRLQFKVGVLRRVRSW